MKCKITTLFILQNKKLASRGFVDLYNTNVWSALTSFIQLIS